MDAKKDPLIESDAVVPWEEFCPLLEQVWRKPEAGAARILSDTTVADVRVSELADPRPGDLIILGTESFVIQGEPVRDSERLVWSLDLRPS